MEDPTYMIRTIWSFSRGLEFLQIGPDLWKLPDEHWPQNPAASFHYTGWFRPRDSPIGLL